MDVTEPGVLTGAATEAGESGAEAAAEAPAVTALVIRAKEGDAEAFGDLMRLYERRIIALGLQMGLRREDALDACQEAFVKVFRYIGRFETGRSFFKWLYRIAVHAAYDQMREARGVPAAISIEDLDMTEAGRIRDESPSLQARLEAVQLAERVRQSLGCLTRQERIVFVLRDLHDIGTDEIGTILKLSPITVRRHCMSARHKIREQLLPRRA